MVSKLNQYLVKNVDTYDKMSVHSSTAEWLLDFIEKEGMLPPLRSYIATYEAFGLEDVGIYHQKNNTWEDET